MYHKLFFQHFLRNPKDVGAVLPLNKHVAEELIKELRTRAPHERWHILEVGAGMGNISQQIEPCLHSGDQLDLVEIDQECCSVLENRFKNNPRIATHCLSILDWAPSYQYDFIVSTLPFNSFPPEKVETIFAHYLAISHPAGRCSYVEYMGLEKLGLLFANKESRGKVLKRQQVIHQLQQRFLVEKVKIYTNFLPCYVYHLKWNSHP